MGEELEREKGVCSLLYVVWEGCYRALGVVRS